MVLLPVLETKRLFLRPVTKEDAPSVFAYAKHPEVGPNAGWKPHEDISESERFIDYCIKKRDFGQPGNYAIILKSEDKMIGTIEVHSYKEHKGEIGFVLHPDYWNQGIMTEAAKMVIVYAFEILQLERLSYNHFLGNERSKRVCEKLQFQFEGVLRKKFKRYDGVAIDEAVYSIIDTDYFSKKLTWLKSFRNEIDRLR
jgi:RimJ/RimL family protein N-acetyltransferase